MCRVHMRRVGDGLEKVLPRVLACCSCLQSMSITCRTILPTFGCSRSVAWRFGKYLGHAVPLAVTYCKEAGEGEDELQEYCLQALESFMQRCPHVAKEYFEAIFDIGLSSLRYDPNYTEDMDENGSADEEEEYALLACLAWGLSCRSI